MTRIQEQQRVAAERERRQGIRVARTRGLDPTEWFGNPSTARIYPIGDDDRVPLAEADVVPVARLVGERNDGGAAEEDIHNLRTRLRECQSNLSNCLQSGVQGGGIKRRRTKHRRRSKHRRHTRRKTKSQQKKRNTKKKQIRKYRKVGGNVDSLVTDINNYDKNDFGLNNENQRPRSKLRDLIKLLAQGNRSKNQIVGFKEDLIREIFNFLKNNGSVNESDWTIVRRNFNFPEPPSGQYNKRPIGVRLGF